MCSVRRTSERSVQHLREPSHSGRDLVHRRSDIRALREGLISAQRAYAIKKPPKPKLAADISRRRMMSSVL
jgi:hypothetical protein